MGKREVKYKASMTRDQVAAYLEDLAACIKAGTVCVQKGNECVVLNPTDNLKVEIEAGEKKDKFTFGLELTFYAEAMAQADSGELRITPDPPVFDSPAEPGAAPAEAPACEAAEEEKPYKKLKKKMKKSFKEIAGLLESGQMPPLVLVEAFISQCQEMTTFEGSGDEYYERFNAQAYDILGSAQSGDLEAFREGFQALGEMKNECHARYKK